MRRGRRGGFNGGMPRDSHEPQNGLLAQYRRALVALNDMNIALHTARSMDELLHVLVVKAFEGLGFDRGLIYLREGSYLRVAAAIDLIRMEHGGVIHRRIGYDLTRETAIEIDALRTAKLVHVRDARSNPRVSPKFRYATSSTPEYCAVPILGREDAIGVLTIDKFYSGEEITETEKFFLEIFARHIGVAIESLRASRELESQVEEKSREIRRLQLFLEAVFRNIPAAVLTMDAKGRLTAANPAALGAWGLPELGVPRAEESLPAEVREAVRPLLRWMREGLGGTFVSDRTVRIGPDRMYSVSTAPLRDASGHRVGVVCIAADVTEKERIQQTLQRMARLSALGTLAAGVAHEIRNPLAGISGLVQILQSRVQDLDPRNRLIEKVIEEIDRLNGIVRDLLRFSKPGGTGKGPVVPAELYERVLLLCRKDLESRKIWVRREWAWCPPVFGDAAAVQQALLNLVINAAQAMRGGGTLTLGVAPSDRGADDVDGLWRWIRDGMPDSRSARSVVFWVRDTGEGMPPDVLAQVFHPFFTTRREGTGLGLYLVHRIAEDHGGVVLVDSQEGRGTVFYLALPAAGGGA